MLNAEMNKVRSTLNKCARAAYLTTLVPPLTTCMSTLQVPFECEMRLTSENSAYMDETQRPQAHT